MSHVLIAEDSPTQAQELKLLLEDEGFQVAIAKNGLEAKSIISQSMPDIVITDMDMPVMNGLQLVEYIRREHADLPVVLMTAFGSEEIAALALPRGRPAMCPRRTCCRTSCRP